MHTLKHQFLFTLFGMTISMFSFAENNVDVITTISVGTVSMQLDIKESFTGSANINGNTTTISSNPKMPGAEIGVTVLDDKLYYGFTMLVTGQSVARLDLSYYDSSTPSITESSNQIVTSRTAYSVYSGYSFTDNTSFYGGAAFGAGSYGSVVFIDEFGPFIGSSYAYRFSYNSSLNFDISYSMVNVEATLNDGVSTDEHTIISSNRAISVSAAWLKALDRGRSFFIRLKFIDLVLAGSTSVRGIGGGTGTATIDGSQFSTNLSLGMGF